MSFLVVWGAGDCRDFLGVSKTAFNYWRQEARGEDRFPNPCCAVNGRSVEIWDPGEVLEWHERTKARRRAGLAGIKRKGKPR